MFQVCLLFESVLTLFLFVWPYLRRGRFDQCRRSSLYLRFRLIGENGVDHAVLRLKCFDQSLAFARHLGTKLRLVDG